MPIDAILFGGRRATVVPLVTRRATGSTACSSARSCPRRRPRPQAGAVGKLRFDPMAMLPFCGYNMADYFAHWLQIGAREGAKLPKIFYVNWFRKDDDGKFLWPGLRRELARAGVDLPPLRGHGGRGRDADRPACRRSARAGSTPTASTSATRRWRKLLERRPRAAGSSSCRRCTSTTRGSATSCRRSCATQLERRSSSGSAELVAGPSVGVRRLALAALRRRPRTPAVRSASVALPFIPSDAGAARAPGGRASRLREPCPRLRAGSSACAAAAWALVPIASIVRRDLRDPLRVGHRHRAHLPGAGRGAAARGARRSGWASRGATPWLALAAIPLFVLAWLDAATLAGRAGRGGAALGAQLRDARRAAGGGDAAGLAEGRDRR